MTRFHARVPLLLRRLGRRRLPVESVPPRPVPSDRVRRPNPDATQEIWNQAHRVLSAGLWSLSHGAYRYPDGLFPLLADSGEGCHLWDHTGRRYIDWMMAWGPVTLGYGHPRVAAAIREQLSAGPLLSLLHPIEVEVASRLCQHLPCAERVAFGKNGSDVLEAGVRIARAVTGRDVVLVHGYHGFHDWYVASLPQCEGVPPALRELVHPFRYNDLACLRSLLDRFAQRVAAVVMEPTNIELPAPGFLEGVRATTREHGCLLIFDEIITGFRLGMGGAQERFGVVPDLACVGKALANGMPLSALVGRDDLMQVLHRVGYGLTFRGETLSLAAARACLDEFEREPVFEHLERVGESMRAGYHEIRDRIGVDTTLIGPAPRLDIAFAPAGRLSDVGMQTLFIQECVKRGVITNGSLLPSFAHDDATVEITLAAARAALEVTARASESSDPGAFLQFPPEPGFFADREDDALT